MNFLTSFFRKLGRFSTYSHKDINPATKTINISVTLNQIIFIPKQEINTAAKKTVPKTVNTEKKYDMKCCVCPLANAPEIH